MENENQSKPFESSRSSTDIKSNASGDIELGYNARKESYYRRVTVETLRLYVGGTHFEGEGRVSKINLRQAQNPLPKDEDFDEKRSNYESICSISNDSSSHDSNEEEEEDFSNYESICSISNDNSSHNSNEEEEEEDFRDRSNVRIVAESLSSLFYSNGDEKEKNQSKEITNKDSSTEKDKIMMRENEYIVIAQSRVFVFENISSACPKYNIPLHDLLVVTFHNIHEDKIQTVTLSSIKDEDEYKSFQFYFDLHADSETEANGRIFGQALRKQIDYIVAKNQKDASITARSRKVEKKDAATNFCSCCAITLLWLVCSIPLCLCSMLCACCRLSHNTTTRTPLK